MSRNGCEYFGKIPFLRAVEDSIRATKKYTEGIRTMRAHHPIQGEAFPSKVFCKYYEVYPEIDLRGGTLWDLPMGVGFDLLWRDTPCIDVIFKYDYRGNKASILIEDGADAVKLLSNKIPKFSDTLARVIADESKVIVEESGKANPR